MKKLNNKILTIAKKMEPFWDGFLMLHQIKVDGELIVVRTTEGVVKQSPKDFIVEWADSILFDYFELDKKYVNEDELAFLVDIKRNGIK